MKIRWLTVLPACVLGALALSGCESKVGTAAVVGGDKISESSLSDLLTPQAQPIPVTQTESVSARSFVLQVLIANKVYEQALAANGKSVSQQQLDASAAAALPGLTPQQLTEQVTKVGLTEKFGRVYLHNRELATVLPRLVTDQAKLTTTVTSTHVVVNPRFGSWDNKNFTLQDLSRSQLPSFIAYNGTFPGDPQPSQ